MSGTTRSKLRAGIVALALVGGTLVTMPAAEARVGVGLNLILPPPVAPPPIALSPPVVAVPAAPASPPVVIAPMPYYAQPYYYASAPAYDFYWFDRFGHRRWYR